MKKIIFTLSFVLATSIAFSQENTTTLDDSFRSVPNFPECKGDKLEMKVCFQTKMQKFISKKFNSDLPNELALKPGEYRMILLFKVEKDGSITNMKVNAPHEKLQEEGLRILKLLPKLSPAIQNGVAVSGKMVFPMRIYVEDSKKNWKRYRKAQKKKNKEAKF